MEISKALAQKISRKSKQQNVKEMQQKYFEDKSTRRTCWPEVKQQNFVRPE